jgi:endogenous inhibitor of DNA gyrase (YacG/DUF329 family)
VTTDPRTTTCPICWTTFTTNQPLRLYCSHRCKKTAYQRRHQPHHTGQPQPAEQQTTPTPPQPQPAAHRNCPHCGQPITIVALLTTPHAARPTPPAPDHPANEKKRC